MMIHGSCVCFERQRGVLITGASGSGKSSLALELISSGAKLVSDDQTTLSVHESGRLCASPPETLAGLMEIYGVGFIRQPYENMAYINLVCDLSNDVPDRLPDYERSINYLGVDCLFLKLKPRHPLNVSVLRTLMRADVDYLGLNT
jgi:HPr kinase/phosphorylase